MVLKCSVFMWIMSIVLFPKYFVRSAAERRDGDSAVAEGGDEAEGDIVEGETKLNLHCTYLTKKL